MESNGLETYQKFLSSNLVCFFSESHLEEIKKNLLNDSLYFKVRFISDSRDSFPSDENHHYVEFEEYGLSTEFVECEECEKNCLLCLGKNHERPLQEVYDINDMYSFFNRYQDEQREAFKEQVVENWENRCDAWGESPFGHIKGSPTLTEANNV